MFLMSSTWVLTRWMEDSDADHFVYRDSVPLGRQRGSLHQALTALATQFQPGDKLVTPEGVWWVLRPQAKTMRRN